MYRTRTTPTFEKDIRRLDRPTAGRILEKMEWLSERPELLQRQMKYVPEHLKGLQKYRVGDWRVLFWVDHQKKELILYGVEHRSTVYRRFRRK